MTFRVGLVGCPSLLTLLVVSFGVGEGAGQVPNAGSGAASGNKAERTKAESISHSGQTAVVTTKAPERGARSQKSSERKNTRPPRVEAKPGGETGIETRVQAAQPTGVGASSRAEQAAKKPTLLQMTATAHSLRGLTKSGTPAREGTVAADPRVLPLGSRIRIYGRNGCMGEFTVTDIGPKVKGHIIDMFVPTTLQAVLWGRRRVNVEVLEYGPRRAKIRRVGQAARPAIAAKATTPKPVVDPKSAKLIAKSPDRM